VSVSLAVDDAVQGATLSRGTSSKDVDSVLAVASVVRTVVLGVITSRSLICGERYRCAIPLPH
jgi:hypothetical protein